MPPIERVSTARRQRIKFHEALFRRRRMDLMTEAIENMAIVIPFEPIAMRHDSIDRRTKRCSDLGSGEIFGGDVELLSP
jgi:hypothetical protein